MDKEEHLGERLRAVRERAGLDQTRFGRQVEASRSAVHSWETNTRFPSARTLRLICEQFQVSADWLLFGARPLFDTSALDSIQGAETLDEAVQRQLQMLGVALSIDARIVLKDEANRILRRGRVLGRVLKEESDDADAGPSE